MNNTTHKEIARIVGEKHKIPELQAFIDGAGTPDYVDDLLVKLPGAKYWSSTLLGYHISPWQHFCKPVGKRKYNGYCMARDPSWPQEVRPPIGTLMARSTSWLEHLGMQSLGPAEHPMASILQVSTGKAPTQITYCTAPVYAGWLASQIRRPEVAQQPAVFWKGVGAIAHLAMDLCVWHHVFNCLLAGHQEYEGRIQEWAIQNQKLIESWPLPASISAHNTRILLEGMAEVTGARKSKPSCNWAVRKGFGITSQVVYLAGSWCDEY